jgi:hypothetical protein
MGRTAVINQIRGLLLERGIINNAPWRRTWINRREYVHPYEVRRYGWKSASRAERAARPHWTVSARRRAKDATPWKSTAITPRANLPSGQKVLDAPKQATETAKKGKEGVGSATLMSALPLSTAIPIHISI